MSFFSRFFCCCSYTYVLCFLLLGNKVFKELLDQFQSRKQGTSLIPFILETSDFLWARSRNLIQNRESFQAYHLNFFQRAELERLLTKPLNGYSDEPVFTKVFFLYVCYFLFRFTEFLLLSG